ncbi:MAG: flavodoxin [Chloroflexota bacterium]|nr:MAG: flavodoxin [Chloroflexota bacterium]
MPKIGLFYGSNEGHTEAVAYKIKAAFDRYEADMVDVRTIAQSQPEDILRYDYIIFGAPTYDVGQLQDDWDIFLPLMDEMDFTGKKLAMFGLGDQYVYSATFVDAIGIIARKAISRGAELVGTWPRDEYEFEDSVALDEDDFLMGLALDEDNESHLTDERIEAWVPMVMEEFGLLDPASA